jgi:hypothetical protein
VEIGNNIAHAVKVLQKMKELKTAMQEINTPQILK